MVVTPWVGVRCRDCPAERVLRRDRDRGNRSLLYCPECGAEWWHEPTKPAARPWR